MTIPLFALPPPRPGRPRCDDCGRIIWSPRALRRWRGLRLGSRCARRRRRNSRRLTVRITVTPPGDIPGQTDVLQLPETP